MISQEEREKLIDYIDRGFSSDEIMTIAFDFSYSDLYYQLSHSMCKDEKIAIVADYVIKNDKVSQFLDFLRSYDSDMYRTIYYHNE